MFVSGDPETVEFIRSPGKDRFGDPKPGTAQTTAVHGCLVAPGTSSEDNVNAAQVDTWATVYAPLGVEKLGADQARIRGQLFKLVGTPQVWNNAGVVVAARRVTG